MLTIDSLFLLVYHYHCEKDNDCFNKAINLAEKELDNVLDESREYPPFIYYLILENMDNNPKYDMKKFICMSREEKIDAFNNTISNLRSLE